MPTVLLTGPYIGSSFMLVTRMNQNTFMSSEMIARQKFWLDPIRLERSGGFGRSEMRRIQFIVEEHHSFIVGGLA